MDRLPTDKCLLVKQTYRNKSDEFQIVTPRDFRLSFLRSFFSSNGSFLLHLNIGSVVIAGIIGSGGIIGGITTSCSLFVVITYI